MRRSLLSLVFCLAMSIALVSPIGSPAPLTSVVKAQDKEKAEEKAVAGDDKLVQDVKKVIDEGVGYLLARQDKDGGWEAGVSQSGSGGATSLVLLALLESGQVKPTHKAVKNGLEWLRKNPTDKTYGAGLQTMLYCYLNDNADRKRIGDLVGALVKSRMKDGWSYGPLSGKAGFADNSNTQYALLGIHEANQRHADKLAVDRKVLTEIRDHFLATQNKAGGWSYNSRNQSATMNMTTAGLCNLIITGLDLSEGKAVLRKDGSAEKCGEYTENEAVARALEWIGARFPAQISDDEAAATFSHGGAGAPFYGLYGVERAGRLSGQRYFGGHDWYEIGCRWLVKAQKADGSWDSSFCKQPLDNYKAVATSFALLFLSKGRTPVLISKMAFGGKDYLGWNNKRNDLKHVVGYLSRSLFENKPLAWQVFDVRNVEANTEASRRKLAAELLQAPIAFVSSHDFAPRDKEEEVLKEFLGNGGFLLAENCCGKARHPAFDKDFARFIKNILPDAELKTLEVEHPVWTASGKFTSSPRDFPLLGVKQGCKTVVVYSPVPLAGYWEANAFADKDAGQKAFELMANITAYATGMEVPRPRLSRVEIVSSNPKEKPKRGYLQVGQLRHEGDWQPAPKAMMNLMKEGRKAGLDVILKTEAISPFGNDPPVHRFLYLHGRNAFSAKKEDLNGLRFNLKNGGLLLADACCGSKTFDASFRQFIVELFGDDKLKLEPIPVKDDLFSADLNGTAIDRVRRRVPTDGGKKVSKEYSTLAPELEGVKYKNRWIVIYSKTDIGCALEKHGSSECLSHDHESALKIARAALLYGLKR